MTASQPTPDPERAHPATDLHAPAFDRLTARIAEEQRAADRIMEMPVSGPRGQQMALAEARAKATEIGNRIDLDESRGSLRHRTVGRTTKVVTLALLALIDFPVMLWLAGSVFNVDWSAPLGLPLAISAVIAVLGTAGAAWTLHHLGHNRREDKNDRRHLDWARMSAGARSSMAGVALLVALISVVMFERVHSEGVLSGLDELALLLALLVAFIMLLSAALVFSTAFRDGSPEQDDLAHYSHLVHDGLRRRREHEDQVARLRHERDLLRTSEPATATPVAPAGSDDSRPEGTDDRGVVRPHLRKVEARRSNGLRRPLR